MVETSTLERVSSLRLEEELALLEERKVSSENTERRDGRTPIRYILLGGFESQFTFPPVSPRNDSRSDRNMVEPQFTGSRTSDPVETSSFWRRILSAQRLLERSRIDESNYWPMWYNPVDVGFPSGGNFALRAAEPLSFELVEALTDLYSAVEEAEEQRYPTPSNVALSNAGRLLRKLYGLAPRRFEVYPTPDGEIAIDAPSDRSSFVVLCDSKGGALCMANLPSGHRTKCYSTTDTLPDSFVSEALAEISS